MRNSMIPRASSTQYNIGELKWEEEESLNQVVVNQK